jgi:hypothetical protein
VIIVTSLLVWLVMTIPLMTIPPMTIPPMTMPIRLLPVAVIFLALLLFGTLAVAVDERQLSLRFGIGLIRRNIPLADIRSFKAVRNPWYYGWGVRFNQAGRLYNVSGLSAVDLLLNDGKHVRVGTDEPEALVGALRRAIGEPRPLTPEERRADVTAGRRLAALVGFGSVAIAMAVLGVLYAGMQPPSVNISASGLAIRGGAFYAVDMPMTDIVELSLQDTIPGVTRKINGFNAGNTLRGHFQLQVLGDGQLFINRGVAPYLVVKTRDSFVIVNFKDPQRTRDLYASLKQRLQAR